MEEAADGVLNGVVCEADGGAVEPSVVDESDVRGIGDVGEGIEEEVEGESGREEVEKKEDGGGYESHRKRFPVAGGGEVGN